jgi:hypothetical protein
MQDFMKIRPVEAALFHADEQAWRRYQSLLPVSRTGLQTVNLTF